ncbi:MAG: NfeD family protein [Cyanobacteria bacterium SBLK]|nr:NfeD family protein [Cyanobacteria bacterium SBLK]
MVTEAIQPNCRGCVQFRGSWWFARSLTEITVSPGVWVNVIGRDELTLLVELPKAIDFQQN